MRSIIAVELQPVSYQEIRVPEKSKAIHVAPRGGGPHIFLMIDDEFPPVSRGLLIVDTGERISTHLNLTLEYDYVGTIHAPLKAL